MRAIKGKMSRILVLKSWKCKHEATHIKDWLATSSSISKLGYKVVLFYYYKVSEFTSVFSDLLCVLNINSTLAMNFSLSQITSQNALI